MKEVILKSDLEKVICDEMNFWREHYLASEIYRGGALDALQRLYEILIYDLHSDLKGGENHGKNGKKIENCNKRRS